MSCHIISYRSISSWYSWWMKRWRSLILSCLPNSCLRTLLLKYTHSHVCIVISYHMMNICHIIYSLSCHIMSCVISYHMTELLTMCGATPPLDELLRLWDFFFAYGIHMSLVCALSQFILIRESLVNSPSPMAVVHNLPPLHSANIIAVAMQVSKQIPESLWELVVRHCYDPTILDNRIWSRSCDMIWYDMSS